MSPERARALDIIDRDFRTNQVVPQGPPTRFQLNLTESCNLRCAHCITYAPERTAAGTARIMGEPVLAALVPHLQHASYVGLTHAGEPTTAPLLVPLLEALRITASDAVIHVLTNGHALRPERFVELTRLGVRSWSVSLDGLSAGTHDRLRIGSKVDALTERLGSYVELGRPLGARIGIAYTVTRANLGELEGLVELAHRLGVDWVKLEEVVPVNALATELAAIDPEALRAAVRRAEGRAEALQVRLLDHTRPLATWKCELDSDPAMAHRSYLDDFLNRVEINPCRLPTEVVCVEPNGDVRPVDFHHPVAGNLGERDLLEIWRAPQMVLARSRQIARRKCGPGPVRCASDPGPSALEPISFSYRGAPGRQVELLGDFPTFKHAHRMLEAEPGLHRITLPLEPGVYRYKFRIDQHHWVADPTAPIDRAEGYENSVVIVGGTKPPFFFAPDSAHVRRTAEHLLLRAESIAEGVRSLYAEEVPVAGDATHFELDGVSFPLPPVDREGPPDWAKRAVYYGIFVDRWHRGSGSPPDPRVLDRRRPSSPSTFYGGDLDGIREWLPELADLGVDALLLSPIHRADSAHRYDALDLAAIDPRLGGEAAFARLSEAAHVHGLNLVLDAAFTHVSARHPAFVDLLKNQRRSAYADWFRVRRFPVLLGDLSSYDAYADLPHLPRLAVESPAVEDHLVEIGARLVALGADGFRLDAMDDAPRSFWARFRRRLKSVRPDLVFLGEVVHDRYALHLGKGGADQVTDFRRRSILIEAFARGRMDAAELWSALHFADHRAGPFGKEAFLGFLDNHDTARFRSIAIDHDRLRLALTFLLGWPGPAAITYGTEAGLAGGGNDADRDHVWRERLPMPPAEALGTRTRILLGRLLRLRRSEPGLATNQVRRIVATGDGLLLERGSGLYCAYNLGRQAWQVPWDRPVRLLVDTQGATDPNAPLEGHSARWVRAIVASKPT